MTHGDPKNPKKNPHPKERYEITFTIRDAPGPFDSITASAAYEISNKDCVPTQPISGANPSPSPIISFDVTHVNTNTYRGYVYLDLLQDEDYYGLGVCHWALTSAGPDIKVRNVNFGGSLDSGEIAGQKTVIWYQWKPYYNNPPASASSSSPLAAGVPLSVYEQSKDKSKYFSVELTARKDSP
ncbi:MAG: hypothetical protein ACREPQ_17005 [Rhodanobacter sp.]